MFAELSSCRNDEDERIASFETEDLFEMEAPPTDKLRRGAAEASERTAARVRGWDGGRAFVDGGGKSVPTDDVGTGSGGESLLLLLDATPWRALAGGDSRRARATGGRGDHIGRRRDLVRGRRARGRTGRGSVPPARGEGTSVERVDELSHSLHDPEEGRLAEIGGSGVAIERNLPEEEAHRRSHGAWDADRRGGGGARRRGVATEGASTRRSDRRGAQRLSSRRGESASERVAMERVVGAEAGVGRRTPQGQACATERRRDVGADGAGGNASSWRRGEGDRAGAARSALRVEGEVG